MRQMNLSFVEQTKTDKDNRMRSSLQLRMETVIQQQYENVSTKQNKQQHCDAAEAVKMPHHYMAHDAMQSNSSASKVPLAQR